MLTAKSSPSRRRSAPLVHQELRDGDGPARRHGVEGPLQQRAAALFAFAVQDVAERGDVIAAAMCYSCHGFCQYKECGACSVYFLLLSVTFPIFVP